ncbi:hypothetical protein K474DRAFT_1599105, partial [Panus rudis PR-1116 ss-1]
MNRFSQELVDICIDYLHDDQRALRTCSLVCRSWLASARHHLLESVVIKGITQKRGLNTFMDFLDKEPYARTHIRHVRI